MIRRPAALARATPAIVRRVKHGANATAASIADALGCSPATVSRWCRADRHRRRLGRPRGPDGRRLRRSVRAAVLQHAGRVTIRQLRRLHPRVPRRVLEEVRKQVRAELDRTRRRALCACRWHRPGSVWAIDHTEVWGERGQTPALVVRDLASRKTLLARCVPGTGADPTSRVLRGLFAAYGAPLVIKLDNGSGFASAALRACLRRHGVQPLYSPVRRPQYNGACESGIGWLLRTAADLAVICGTAPADELAAAAQLLNAMPARGDRCSPDQRWHDRPEIPADLRARLRQSFERRRERLVRARGIADLQAIGHTRRSALERVALRDALCEFHFLTIRRP